MRLHHAIRAASMASDSQPGGGDPVGVYADEVLNDSPYAYWKIDEGSGNDVFDYSQNSFHGHRYSTDSDVTLDGPALFAQDEASATFTGGGNGIDFDRIQADAKTNLSVEAIIEIGSDDPDDSQIIWCEGGHINGIGIGIHNGELVANVVSGGSITGASHPFVGSYLVGDRVQVGAVFDGSNEVIRIIINGVEVETKTTSIPGHDGNGRCRIGTSHSLGQQGSSILTAGTQSHRYVGHISHVSLYEHALPVSRFLAHFDATGL